MQHQLVALPFLCFLHATHCQSAAFHILWLQHYSSWQHPHLSLPIVRWLGASTLTALRHDPSTWKWHVHCPIAYSSALLIPRCCPVGRYHGVIWHRHLDSALLNAVEGQVIKPLHLRNLASVVPLQQLLKPPASWTALYRAANLQQRLPQCEQCVTLVSSNHLMQLSAATSQVALAADLPLCTTAFDVVSGES